MWSPQLCSSFGQVCAPRSQNPEAETENGGLNKRSRSQGPGSFRAMRPGNGGNLGNFGNVESVTCRPPYSGEGTNPPLRFYFSLNRLHGISISLLPRFTALQGNVLEAIRRYRIARSITVLHLSRKSRHSHKGNEVF